jgi:plastocyanin
VVVHEDAGGAPGADIGNSQLLIGTNENVQIALDRDTSAGETLHAMLHRDADDDGVYDFPGVDVPLKDAQDQVLVAAFQITGNTQRAAEQEADNDTDVEADVDVDVDLDTGENVVIYTNSGFAPGEMAVSSGETVVFRNESSGDFWPASAMHPTHTVYPGSGLDKCGTAEAGSIFDACRGIAPGGEYSFTFSESGSWAYHNHLQASHFGRVNVE